MDIEKLIERLYKHHTDWGEGRTQDFFEVCLDCKDAATALSTLQTENEKLREKIEDARLEGYVKGLGEMSEENERMLAELEQVKRELEAATADLEEIMFKGGHNIDTCHFCTNSQCYGRGGTQTCNPKWRGQKED